MSQKLVEGFIRKLKRRQDTLGKINIQDVNKTCSTITARIHKCSATDPYICQNTRGYNNGGIIKDNAASTMTSNGSYHLNNFIVCETPEFRIRKLTPKECWRLMDFTEEEYESAEKAGVSKTQLYKQAGNSIVVSVLAGIFNNLLGEQK